MDSTERGLAPRYNQTRNFLTSLVHHDFDQRRCSARRSSLVYEAGADLLLLLTYSDSSAVERPLHRVNFGLSTYGLTVQRPFSILSGLCGFISLVCRLANHELECVVHPLYPFRLLAPLFTRSSNVSLLAVSLLLLFLLVALLCITSCETLI